MKRPGATGPGSRKKWRRSLPAMPSTGSACPTAPPVDSPPETFAAGRALVNLFSITGMPTLVVPGWTEGDGLPLGVQLVGPRLSERLLLDAGIAYEDRYGPFPLPRLDG